MSLNAKKVKGNGGGNRVEQPLLENGTYPARLVQVIDLGVQPQKPYQGKEKPPVHMISTTYEFVDEFMIDEKGEVLEDKPRWLSEKFPFYSLEADRAKSTQRYNALDPACVHDGEWPALVNSPVMVSVGSYKNAKGKDVNIILSTAPIRAKEAAKLPALVNDPKVFLLDDPDMEVFLSLPQWLQDEIKGNLNYQGSLLQKALSGKSGASQKAKEAVVEEEQEEEVEGDDVW